MTDFRIGSGYDIHRLVPDRPLILGGVTIPSPLGLLGHSDADALCHAVCDALFGALALGDIGTHYPDTDERYRGADSTVLLADCYRLVREQGYVLVNLDTTVFCERVKLSPHVDAIRARLAAVLGCDVGAVSVKAKTAERMGDIGESRAVACSATVLLTRAK